MEEKKQQTPIQIAREVLDQRLTIVRNTFQEHYIKEIENIYQQIHKVFDSNTDHWNIMQQEFAANIVITATRSWEALSFIKDTQQPRFQDYINQPKYVLTIIEEAAAICKKLKKQFDIIQVDENQMQYYQQYLNQALKQNITVLNQMTLDGTSVDENKINKFVNEQTYYLFQSSLSGIKNSLYGLSSYEGRKIYLNVNYSDLKQKYSKENLEHEAVHNLLRWLLLIDNNRNVDPYIIQAERNPNLRNESGEMIEAGDYYEYKVYKTKKTFISPFCLNKIQRQF